MAIKTITVCDGCGKEIAKNKERFHIVAQSLPYRECAETDYGPIEIDLEFCEDCARQRLLPSLEKLVKANEVKGW